ncbi:MAG: DUF1501 domain-containing protein [Alphaproteobacteria bacterium]|nr:DUF1501 domain-containing protein [Alphaproteobacteria bacterium]
MVRMTRRDFTRLLGSGLMGAGLGAQARSPARAAVAAQERCFLFLFCSGGWDTSFVFTPLGDSPYADTEPEAVAAEIGGLRFVDAPSRPSVRSFFERYADRCCLINGIEVQSVTHERCRELILTGRSNLGGDDWPSILAALSPEPLSMPHVVLAGPAFTRDYSSRVVRIGDGGQLPQLLSEDVFAQLQLPGRFPSPEAQALEEAFLRGQLLGGMDPSASGQKAAFERRYATALADLDALRGASRELNLTPLEADCERDIVADAETALDCFSLGLSRCAMLRYNGWCNEGWDTHQGLELQDINFEDLFAYLTGILQALDSRPGRYSETLADEVTVVLFSEMGRSPQLNAWEGKDHWTFTSTMLIGSGVAGGRTLGAVDEYALGRRLDLASGELHDAGERLLPEHLGATLLALGDVDPGPFVGGMGPILAALEGG